MDDAWESIMKKQRLFTVHIFTSGFKVFTLAFNFLCLHNFTLASPNSFTFYVAANGNDKWSGKLQAHNKTMTDGPFLTLERARDAVRELRSYSTLNQPVRIIISEGDYTLLRPFVLTSQDSGTLKSPVIYEAAKNSKPRFIGGKIIKNWRKIKDDLWVTNIPEVKRGKWYFEQLWVNSRRATRARTPNLGFNNIIASKVQNNVRHPNAALTNISTSAFVVRSKDIKNLSSLRKDQLRDVMAIVFHSWESSRLPVCCLDLNKHIIFSNGNSHWPFLSWSGEQRYFLENFRDALDSPGEWFLERNGNLYYKPLPNETIQTTEIVAPYTEQFIRFEGKPEKNIEYLKIKGLSFRYGQYNTPATGISNGQAADGVPAVIMADYIKNVDFVDNEIAHIGTYAIWLRRGVKQVRIEGNYLFDLGAGGIRVGEGIILPQQQDQTHFITMSNNFISNGGHFFPGAVGIWVGQSGDNQISHNEISYLYYTGISVGWTWGYGESLAKRNRIGYNKIHHIGQYMLSDLGGIYTLGTSNGTVIENNLIHDIKSFDNYGRGGWGIYNDQGSSNILTKNNLVFNAKTGGYHLNDGMNNTLKNNIFALSKDGQLQNSVKGKNPSISFINNIVYWDASDLFRGDWSSPGVFFSSNIFWNNANNPPRLTKSTLQNWNSYIVNPRFVDPKNGNFKFYSDSSIRKINFKPFDYSIAGLNRKLKWIDKK
jgi:hypothetical protein